MGLRRTRNISLFMLAAIAAAACDENQQQSPQPNPNDLKHCVDENGVVQEESKCADSPEHHPMGPDGGPIASHPSSGGGGHFFWYYGGVSSPVSPGSRVTGGSYVPSTGRSYSTPSTYSPSISRGGFGSTGAGKGGGGGGGSGGGS